MPVNRYTALGVGVISDKRAPILLSITAFDLIREGTMIAGSLFGQILSSKPGQNVGSCAVQRLHAVVVRP